MNLGCSCLWSVSAGRAGRAKASAPICSAAKSTGRAEDKPKSSYRAETRRSKIGIGPETKQGPVEIGEVGRRKKTPTSKVRPDLGEVSALRFALTSSPSPGAGNQILISGSPGPASDAGASAPFSWCLAYPRPSERWWW